MSRQIKIFGERNTNTNYLEQLIHLNLDVEQVSGVAPYYIKTIQKILPGKEWLRDRYFSATLQSKLGWKHTRIMSQQEFMNFDVLNRGICFLSITKNPYSWLLSLYRKPYSHQYSGPKPDFETFLRSPWKTVARDNCDAVLPNPVALWNIKNASYLQLKHLNGLNITTESTIRDPEAVIAKVSEHFSIDRLSPQFLNYEKSTKDSTKDFAYYQDYYLNQKWRNELSAQAVCSISDAVDKKLMHHFAYEVL